MTPTRARRVRPPVEVIAEVDGMRRLVENNRTGHEHLRLSARVVPRIQRTFGDRQVACRLDEAAELFVGDRGLVHQEAFDGHVMSRRFFGIMIIRPHEKSSAGYPRHVFIFHMPYFICHMAYEIWHMASLIVRS